MAEQIEKGLTSWRRRTARQSHPAWPPSTPQTVRCSLCHQEIANATKALYGNHVRQAHAGALTDAAVGERGGSTSAIESLWKAVKPVGGTGTTSTSLRGQPKPPANGRRSANESGTTAATATATAAAFDGSSSPRWPHENIRSPVSSLKRESSRSSSPHKRSKPRPASPSPSFATSDADIVKRPHMKGTLWTPGAQPQLLQRPPHPTDRANIASAQRSSRSGQPAAGGGGGAFGPPAEEDTSVMIKQPDTRPISQEQLVAEVKGIYAGLVMVESKCIEVDNAQLASLKVDPTGTGARTGTGTGKSPKLNNEQWQALIALHRTLIREHHDFFLASQHPSAAPPLRRLATKHRLPESREHMVASIYIAYSMLTLLFETVPAFENTWIECLGDLGRYRMAIEEHDIRQREIWTDVSCRWYIMASDRLPTTGRLYHHMAILARPHGFAQLFYYSKSLCVRIPFENSRQSIMTLLNPVMHHAVQELPNMPAVEREFIRCHGIMFSKQHLDDFDDAIVEGEAFPHDPAFGGGPRLLPEDFYLRGFLWTERYYPDDLFGRDTTDLEERFMEAASMAETRKERAIYLGCRIAARAGGRWLRWDEGGSGRFSAAPEYDDAELEEELFLVPGAAAVVAGGGGGGKGKAARASDPDDGTGELGELPDAAGLEEA
ncbi:hypothetical protein VTK56DRAFT_3214 [Thermocarpiscus australiensis]